MSQTWIGPKEDSYRMHQLRDGAPQSSSTSSQLDDNKYLARTGKRPILRRNFGFVSILAFSFLVLSTWVGAFDLIGIGLKNGGPAGLIYQFILVWIGNIAVFTSLAELASMAPTAGGQYHWVSLLAPKKYQKGWSYVTGWLTVLGWQANVASSSYVCGTLLQAFIQIVNPNYTSQLWHATLLTYASVLVGVVCTTYGGEHLPRVENALLAFYILGFFGCLVPIVYLGPHGSAHDVFATFINTGGWSSQTLSFFVGISGNAYCFLGADSVYHMSEEIQDSPVTVPRSMIWSITLNGVVGLSMYIAVLFCAGDIDAAINSSYVYPFVEIVLQATSSRAGSAVIAAIIVIVFFGLVIGVVAASSRMLWAFARDRGVPCWTWLRQVRTKSTIPLNAILVTVTITVLLNLISVGSYVALNDVLSLTVCALYASYLTACALLLWRRLSSSIVTAENVSEDRTVGITNIPGSGGKLVWGPWRVKEPLGTVINIFAIVYLVIVFFFSFWPPSTPVTPDTMNYGILVFGVVAIASGMYYVLIARKVYQGPVIEVST